MIKLLPIFYLFTLLALCNGCSVAERLTRSATPELNKDYTFSLVDLPQSEKFLVEVSPISKSPMCMTNSTWPSTVGRLDGASRSVFIVVGEKKYLFKDYSMGYCPFKECAIKIKKGGEMEAALFYKDFNFPVELYSQPKNLVFDPKPYWCDQGKWMN